MSFPCPGCRRTLKVDAAQVGKPGRCGTCGARFSVPARRDAGREAFEVVRVSCACGRQVAAPRVMIEQGKARCPTCDRTLDPGATA